MNNNEVRVRSSYGMEMSGMGFTREIVLQYDFVKGFSFSFELLPHAMFPADLVS